MSGKINYEQFVNKGLLVLIGVKVIQFSISIIGSIGHIMLTDTILSFICMACACAGYYFLRKEENGGKYGFGLLLLGVVFALIRYKMLPSSFSMIGAEAMVFNNLPMYLCVFGLINSLTGGKHLRKLSFLIIPIAVMTLFAAVVITVLGMANMGILSIIFSSINAIGFIVIYVVDLCETNIFMVENDPSYSPIGIRFFVIVIVISVLLIGGVIISTVGSSSPSSQKKHPNQPWIDYGISEKEYWDMYRILKYGG